MRKKVWSKRGSLRKGLCVESDSLSLLLPLLSLSRLNSSPLYLIDTDSPHHTLFLHRESCSSLRLVPSHQAPLFISLCPLFFLSNRCLLKSLLLSLSPPLSLPTLRNQLHPLASSKRRLPKLRNQRAKPLQLPLPQRRNTRNALHSVISRTSSSTR